MPLDPELLGETRGWMQRAGNDLGAGNADLAVNPPFTGDAVFHAQQAAEKSMKGFLTWHSRIFRKTHNLAELGGMCVDIDASLEPCLRRASSLTDYAWKDRYPASRVNHPAMRLNRRSPSPVRSTTQSSAAFRTTFGRTNQSVKAVAGSLRASGRCSGQTVMTCR